MAQAANKLYSRAEIRAILRELRNDAARFLVLHRDAFRNNAAHIEGTCRICARIDGEIRAMEAAYRHFGGRS